MGAGWERPQWFEANASLLTGERRGSDADGWAAPNWSPIVGAEHLAIRERVALFDITPFAKLRVGARTRCAFLERVCANRIDRPVGTMVYTPMLTARGGIRCDLTVTRHRRRSVPGGDGRRFGHARSGLAPAQLRPDERVWIGDRSAVSFCLGLWGPRARDVLETLTDDDVSNDGFPYLTARTIDVGEVPVFAQRISYAGELGWELYGPTEMGVRLWDLLWEAGRPHGMVAAGMGAFDSLRLEKGYRLWGQDLSIEHDPYEAGLGFAVRTGEGRLPGQGGAGGDPGPRAQPQPVVHDAR